MKYSRIISYVQSQLWAIEASKLSEILEVLAFRASGGEFTKEEIEARLSDSRDYPSPAASSGAIGVLSVRGTIAHRMGSMEESSGGTSCESIVAGFRQLIANPNVSTIVGDFATPGGTVTGVPEAAAEIFAARGQKRMIAITNGLNASAGYWLASQFDEVWSIPSGLTGSIGVYTAHADMSEKLKRDGINVTMISAGKYKVEGNPFEPLSDEAKARIQAQVDEVYALFVRDVARGRGVSPSDVRNGYGEGRVQTAKDAKASGLIDKIGTMDDLLGKLSSSRSSRSSRAGARAESDGLVMASDAERRYRVL